MHTVTQTADIETPVPGVSPLKAADRAGALSGVNLTPTGVALLRQLAILANTDTGRVVITDGDLAAGLRGGDRPTARETVCRLRPALLATGLVSCRPGYVDPATRKGVPSTWVVRWAAWRRLIEIVGPLFRLGAAVRRQATAARLAGLDRVPRRRKPRSLNVTKDHTHPSRGVGGPAIVAGSHPFTGLDPADLSCVVCQLPRSHPRHAFL
jgi:hypothetical protein